MTTLNFHYIILVCQHHVFTYLHKINIVNMNNLKYKIFTIDVLDYNLLLLLLLTATA